MRKTLPLVAGLIVFEAHISWYVFPGSNASGAMGVLYTVGCFALGCCGSPMLPIYLSLLGGKFAGVGGPDLPKVGDTGQIPYRAGPKNILQSWRIVSSIRSVRARADSATSL